MRFRVLAQRRRARLGARVIAVAAVAATTMGVGSCGSASGGGSSTVTVTGTRLTIYASVPAGTANGADLLAAERLAFKGTTRVGKYSVRFFPLTGSKVSDNARTAIEDTTSIAYLGELAPGASADSIGITNGADLLQVSPADTALELTQATPAIPSAPGTYYEARSTYGQTFARVVPTTFQEAKAQVEEMQTLKVSKLYLTSDGSPYGRAIAASVTHAAAASGISAVSGPATAAGFAKAGADAIFDGAARARRRSCSRPRRSTRRRSPPVSPGPGTSTSPRRASFPAT
jgi:hypothetical protein